MTPAPSQLTAALLCGGKGERLRPFTESIPKPLVPLDGRPLLAHLLGFLHRQGVRRFVLLTGYLAEQVEAFARAHPLPGAEIVCVDSGEAASMADRLIAAREKLGAGPSLVCYGDTLANVDLGALCAAHARAGRLATLTVYPLRVPFGVVDCDEDGRVRALEEKPRLPYWINIGFALLEPRARERLAPGEELAGFLGRLAQEDQLTSHRHLGRHLTVNTEKERAEAEREIEFFTLTEEGVP